MPHPKDDKYKAKLRGEEVEPTNSCATLDEIKTKLDEIGIVYAPEATLEEVQEFLAQATPPPEESPANGVK